MTDPTPPCPATPRQTRPAVPRPTRAALALAAACAPLALSLPPTAAQAAPVQWTFSGSVVDDPQSSGYQHFSGTLSFDSGAPDLLAADGSAGVYAMPGGQGFQITFDGQYTYHFKSAATVTVLNDFAGGDWLLPLAYADAAMSESLSLDLQDFDAAGLASDALPAHAPALAGFEQRRLRFELQHFGLTGWLDTLSCSLGCSGANAPHPQDDPGTAVPLPGSLPLVLAGLAGLAATTRRRGPATGPGTGIPRRARH